jgi:hypothetical protein
MGLAEGGVATRPVRRLIGERGREAVIPLHRLKDMMGGGTTFNFGGITIGSGRDFFSLPEAEQGRLLVSALHRQLSEDGASRRSLANQLRGSL